MFDLNLILGIVLVLIVIFVLIVIVFYNKLVVLKKRVENAWSQIDVQLKRRADLIPNLVNTVKGYAKFEKSVLTEVTQARTAIMSAKTPADAAKAENQLSGALKSIFAVAEAYPSLKANENFIHLQEELSSTENKVAYARQFYNDSVLAFNTAISTFPGNFFAGLFSMKNEKEYFAVDDVDRKNVSVDFSELY